MKITPLRIAVRAAPALLTLLVALAAHPAVAGEPRKKPLEVTYYYLPG